MISNYSELYPNDEYYELGKKSFRKGLDIPKEIRYPLTDAVHAQRQEWIRGWNDGYVRELKKQEKIERIVRNKNGR